MIKNNNERAGRKAVFPSGRGAGPQDRRSGADPDEVSSAVGSKEMGSWEKRTARKGFHLRIRRGLSMTIPGDEVRLARLERAAASIDGDSLDGAKGAIAARCRIFLKQLDLLDGGLEKVRTAGDGRRFALALSMFLLASLPLRPETCPFCVQHSGGNRCEGCGYAETHGGRCDAETSAFGQLAEAVDDLAGLLHRLRTDGDAGAVDPEDARNKLKTSIARSREAAERLLAGIAGADVGELMAAKRAYIGAILDALPAGIVGSRKVDEPLEGVREKLARYW